MHDTYVYLPRGSLVDIHSLERRLLQGGVQGWGQDSTRVRACGHGSGIWNFYEICKIVKFVKFV